MHSTAASNASAVKAGFTLAELMVTIVIISVLIGLTVALLTTAREKATITTCAGNLRQCGVALFAHASANMGVLLSPARLHQVSPNDPFCNWTPDSIPEKVTELRDFCEDLRVFSCPVFKNTGISTIDLAAPSMDPWYGNPLPPLPTKSRFNYAYFPGRAAPVFYDESCTPRINPGAKWPVMSDILWDCVAWDFAESNHGGNFGKAVLRTDEGGSAYAKRSSTNRSDMTASAGANCLFGDGHVTYGKIGGNKKVGEAMDPRFFGYPEFYMYLPLQ